MQSLPEDCLRLIYKYVYDDVIYQLKTIKRHTYGIDFYKKLTGDEKVTYLLAKHWLYKDFPKKYCGVRQYDTGGVLYSLKHSRVVDLKKMLKENQVKGYSKMKKIELIKSVIAL